VGNRKDVESNKSFPIGSRGGQTEPTDHIGSQTQPSEPIGEKNAIDKIVAETSMTVLLRRRLDSEGLDDRFSIPGGSNRYSLLEIFWGTPSPFCCV
jgi:hypothetical protein